MTRPRHAAKQAAKDRGAVLLTTLLAMTIMAALAVAILDDVRVAVKRAGNMQSFAQADWYMKAADSYAQSYIERQLGQAEGPALNAYLQQYEPIILPLEDGLMAIQARDGSQCLSLSTALQGSGQILFERLLVNLGWGPGEAQSLVAAMADWQDEDSNISQNGAEDYTYLGRTPAYRAANAPFASVSELRSIRGLNEADYQRLRPFVCAGDADRSTAINVNTLAPWQAPLLAAALGENQIPAAEQIITERPPAGYTQAGFKLLPSVDALEAKDVDFEAIVFEPRYIWIEADIDHRRARRLAVLEFRIDSGRATRTYRRYNEDARRPLIKKRDES